MLFSATLASLQLTYGHCWGGSITNLILITAFLLLISLEANWESQNEVGFQSPTKHIMDFERGSFWFSVWCLKPTRPLPPNHVQGYMKSNSNFSIHIKWRYTLVSKPSESWVIPVLTGIWALEQFEETGSKYLDHVKLDIKSNPESRM